MNEKIKAIVERALMALGAPRGSASIEIPFDLANGDYSTNAALVYCKQMGTTSSELASKLAQEILKVEHQDIEKVEIAGSGFVNFFLTTEAIQNENSELKSTIYTKYSEKKILVEHTSPNLFKSFHIGHLMNNIVGEFVTRATSIGGGYVTTLSFPSDVSLGIAKAIYILLEDKKNGNDVFELIDEEKITAFGEAYRRGVAYFEEKPEEIGKAKEIARIIYDIGDEGETRELFEKAKHINNEYFIKIIRGLGSVINETIYEGEAGIRGKEIVLENTGEGKVFTKSEGAVVYIPDENRKDLHTQVFVNSEGHPTYEAKDLGLIDLKFVRFNPDLSYFITDSEQAPHFKVVLDSALKLGGKWTERAEKSLHIPHGRMLFKGQKMSSRLGGVPLALDVINAVEEEVRARAGERTSHLGEDEKKKLEQEIALSALRISVLRSKPGININFDPDTSLSFDGDSGPYLLYTHARTASLLQKGKERAYEPKFKDIPATLLERNLAHYGIVLANSVEEIAPQKLVTYLFEVSQLFNSFYADNQIIGDDKEASQHYLAIVCRVKAVLNEGLWVLGISAPDRM